MGVSVLVGLPLIGFLGIGLLFAGFGSWVLYMAWMVYRATTALKAL